jgi:hypothetical protein
MGMLNLASQTFGPIRMNAMGCELPRRLRVGMFKGAICSLVSVMVLSGCQRSQR